MVLFHDVTIRDPFKTISLAQVPKHNQQKEKSHRAYGNTKDIYLLEDIPKVTKYLPKETTKAKNAREK